MKIRNSLLIFFGFVSIIPIIFMTTYTIIQEEEEETTKAFRILDHTSASIKNTIQEELEGELDEMKDFKSDRIVGLLSEYKTDPTPQKAELVQGALYEFVRYNQDIEYITIADHDNKVIFSTKNEIVGENLQYEFLTNAASTDIVDIAQDDPSEEDHESEEDSGISMHIHLAGPIKNGQELLGILVIDLEDDDIEFNESLQHVGETAHVLVLQKLSNEEILILNSDLEDFETPKNNIIKYAPEMPSALAINGVERIYETQDYRGETVFASTRYIPEAGIGLVLKVDKAEIFESVEERKNSSIISILIMTIGVATAAFFFSSNIQKKVSLLKEHLQRIGAGNFDYNFTSNNKDEISALSTSIQTMAIKLKEHSQLQTVTKQKDEFSAMITHELKTPLVPIIGYCKMLKNAMIGKLDEEQAEAIDVIDRNARRLDLLISDMMDARKLEIDKMKFDITEFSVNEFLGDIESSYNKVLESSGQRLLVSPLSFDVQIKSDKDRLRQVFDNLISNAIKIIPKKHGMIEVGAEKYDNYVILYEKNNGPIIPKEKISEMFQKFYQLDLSQRRKLGGTGLGLAISRGIVEKLGGKIWLESDEKNGTTFYIRLHLD